MGKNESFTAEVERLIGTDRRAEYGGIEESFKRVAKGWTEILGFDISSRGVALCMIWMKMCREINKPKHDNRIDIAGYANCLDELNDQD